MRIAVLGATGMLGRHVLEAGLAGNHDMVAISRSAFKQPSSRQTMESRTADLRDVSSLRRALSGVDAVVHCAGYYPGDPKPLREELATTKELTTNFYEACSGLNLEKIVYVGAAIAIPRNADGRASDGQSSFAQAPDSSNAYVQVKWLQDSLAREQAGKGLPVVLGVPGMTFGEFDPGNTTGQFILGVAQRKFKAFVDGKRNVVYAGDAGRGLILAAESGHPGKRYIFTGENLTMTQIMGKIALATEAPMPKTVPLVVTKAIRAYQLFRYKFLSGVPPAISDTAMAVMSAGQFLDGHTAREELGYKPTISVDDAVQRALAWFKQQGMLDVAATT